jgi:hypothetical protein
MEFIGYVCVTVLSLLGLSVILGAFLEAAKADKPCRCTKKED